MTKPQPLASPRSWIKLLIPAVVLLNLGCAQASTATRYAESSSGYGERERERELPSAPIVSITPGGGAYDFTNDLADGPSSGAEGAVLASRSLEYAPPARSEPGAPSTKAIADEEKRKQAAAAAEAKTGEPAIAKPEDQSPDHGRQIIYVAGMQISVYSRDGAMATIEALPQRFGGWIHMRNESQVVLRLPARQLEPVMAQLASLGVVEARTLQAQDVTAEYVDLESRIKVMRETQAQLLELLGKAKNVEEALHVRSALDAVTMELEVALGRMRQLSDLIAYSTLTVTVVERGPQDNIPTSNDPFRWVDSLGVEATEWR